MDFILNLLIFLIVCCLFYNLIRSLKLDPKTNNYVVLITGCDTGFGNMTAKRLARMGCEVIACCYTEQGVEEFQQLGIKGLRLDISDRDSINKVFEEVSKNYPNGLWALINNAGIGQNSFFEMTDTETFRKVMEVNFFGTLTMTKTFLPLLKQKKGRLIIMTSTCGRLALPGHVAYSCSKFALQSLCDILRLELHRWGITVTNIEPGGAHTGFFDKNLIGLKESWNSAPKEIQLKYGEEWLSKQLALLEKFPTQWVLGNAEKVVDAYVHACLGRFPKSRYVVGFVDTYVHWILSFLPCFISDFVIQKTTLGL